MGANFQNVCVAISRVYVTVAVSLVKVQEILPSIPPSFLFLSILKLYLL